MYKKVYILGPMRGIKNYNFPAFDEAEKLLRAQGYIIVINPATLDRYTGFDPHKLPKDFDWTTAPGTPGMTLDEIIDRDIEAIRGCNAYYTLEGWEKSKGATAEKAVLDWQQSEWLNKPAEKLWFISPLGVQEVGGMLRQAAQEAGLIEDADNRLLGQGGAPTRATTLPTEPKERKVYPIASGVLDYFPDAIVAVSHLSWKGNQQHNPGQPLFWNRAKSGDEADTMMRHFMQRGTTDTDGIRHSVKVVWRALAMLQKEIEAESQAAPHPAESGYLTRRAEDATIWYYRAPGKGITADFSEAHIFSRAEAEELLEKDGNYGGWRFFAPSLEK